MKYWKNTALCCTQATKRWVHNWMLGNSLRLGIYGLFDYSKNADELDNGLYRGGRIAIAKDSQAVILALSASVFYHIFRRA